MHPLTEVQDELTKVGNVLEFLATFAIMAAEQPEHAIPISNGAFAGLYYVTEDLMTKVTALQRVGQVPQTAP
ncbi:hypothetical protein [Desulfovibrio cuneatus]|uniref:hypothetical protein n=1 Tax=Desulfovibrio cuneatus TaxID=159728 RepID=UPI0003F8E824|nr:hypothetical protein [Desulfovibrio cuneatus]